MYKVREGYYNRWPVSDIAYHVFLEMLLFKVRLLQFDVDSDGFSTILCNEIRNYAWDDSNFSVSNSVECGLIRWSILFDANMFSCKNVSKERAMFRY